MRESPSKRHGRSTDQVFECLASETRRATLDALLDRSGAVDVDELATLVTASLSDVPVVDVTRESFEPVHLQLCHRHLPALADADLVTWESEAGVVETTDHPALADPRVRQLIDVSAADWDQVLRSVRTDRRRHVLVVLAEAGDLDRETLARRVVARESDASPADVTDEAVEDALVDLYHVHLPPLAKVGLVDTDDGTVEYAGHPDLEPAWLDFAPADLGETGSDDLTAAHDLWTIEGRESIVSRGQELFDAADDELFLMVTTDGLLEDDCVSKLRNAVDRGVDVYLGSQTPEVRDFVRREIPEVTIWEPQLDWLSLPPRYGRLGRLVFADREAIMVATLGDDGADGIPRETAITGEGPENSMVVLMRQLLGSRLDHLDAQSDDVLSQIPL